MERCWSNCNCVGFNVNSNGTGCITWTGKLEYQEDYANTVPIYVLVRGNSSRGERWIWIVIAVAISLLVLIFGTFCYLRMGKRRLEDPAKRGLLDWTKRLNIIEGVAQGLLYLHKYSRMRVIHRDLKASNVLLDENMNAKISDFGMARIFKINETEANTKRPAGTYGYMSPEYAMLGTFSVKSDVFSFGVLILEIVSGRRNTSFYDFDNRSLNLIGYAWELSKEGTALELKDPALGDSCVTTQFLRIIHVGLLCVQEGAMDRPMMLDVISMLNNEAVVLPAPRQPAFFIGRNVPSTTISDGRRPEDCSVNDLTKSIMEAR